MGRLLHFLGCRQHQLDSLPHNEVPHPNYYTQSSSQSQHGESLSHGLDAALSSRLDCPAGWPEQCSTSHCRDCARYLIEQRQASNRNPGGATFDLSHNGNGACPIPEDDTLILTGGHSHNFVTRWEHEHRNSFLYSHEDANDNLHTFVKQM